jgi:hypothetical protein
LFNGMIQISLDIDVVVETVAGGKLIGPAKTFWVWAAPLKRSAARASVQIDVDVDFVVGQVRVLRTPGRFRVDPRIGRRSGQEIDLHGQIDDRLALARGSDALRRERDPVPVIGFDGASELKLAAAVSDGAHAAGAEFGGEVAVWMPV